MTELRDHLSTLAKWCFTCGGDFTCFESGAERLMLNILFISISPLPPFLLTEQSTSIAALTEYPLAVPENKLSYQETGRKSERSGVTLAFDVGI